MKRIATLLIVSLVAILAGCQSHEVVASSGPRKANIVQSVKILQKQPSKYEELGIVQVVMTPELRWDDRGDATKAFEALKAEAAKLGANGILLTAPSDFVVTAAYKGAYYQVPMRNTPRTALAQAVYVLED